jgi:hypothetical protein
MDAITVSLGEMVEVSEFLILIGKHMKNPWLVVTLFVFVYVFNTKMFRYCSLERQ